MKETPLKRRANILFLEIRKFKELEQEGVAGLEHLNPGEKNRLECHATAEGTIWLGGEGAGELNSLTR